MNQYTHRYSLTAADMDTRYRMTPNAVLLYYQDCWARYMSCLHLAAFDVTKQNRIWVITEFNAWFEEQTALWSDDIDVTVWNSEVGALRLYAEFRLCRRAFQGYRITCDTLCPLLSLTQFQYAVKSDLDIKRVIFY